MIEVLIGDDHAAVRRCLRQILTDTADVHVAAEAASAEDVLQAVRERSYDVVLLDINLPGGNGVDLLAQIRSERPETRVLILTVCCADQYAQRSIKAGAAGFMNKESAPDELTEAVRAIAAGERWLRGSHS